MSATTTESSDSNSVEHPQERLKYLIDCADSLQVDPNVPAFRYYRSGTEMLRQAKVYRKEHNLEAAYVLYLKFMTLFLEKIRGHPTLKEVKKEMRAKNSKDLKNVMPVAEQIKETLKKQYTLEYERHLQSIKKTPVATPVKTAVSVPKLTPITRGPYLELEAPTVNLDAIVFPDESSPPTPEVVVKTESTPPQPPPPQVVLVEKPPENKPSLPSSENDTAFNGIVVPPPPSVDRATKPTSLETNSPTKHGGLRTVIMPLAVIAQFLQRSQRMTDKNVETCAVLAGKLELNHLIITHMVLPKQKGTGDSCVTMNEEELFDVQDENNLITIGWIHTHPTQTAFLSSVDLHTQYSYQVMMPEAIAIVCAPTYKTTGFYVLTPIQGMKIVGSCRKDGFHSHPMDASLYMEAEHLRIEKGAHLSVVDLRAVR